MASSDDILKLLKVQYPIIQAPMVGVSTPELAAAVSNAGALGSIGLGASSVQQAQNMIQETRSLTDKPFNVNLFCHRPAVADPIREAAWLAYLSPFFAEFDVKPPASISESYRSFVADENMLEMLLHERPAVVSFHFGLPPVEWISSLRKAGIVILACATSLKEAGMIEAASVDAVIAQGIEAGGHRGVFDAKEDQQIGTFALVQLIARSSHLPVIAAGGIMNGQGIEAAMKLGAAAVQLGTAFILCPESAANTQFRAALQSERAYHTQISSVISGRPARGMINRLFTDIDSTGAPALPDYPITYDATKALHAAASNKGNFDFAVQWAGQGAPLARALPASKLIQTLVAEWHAEGG
ncbi:MAG: nitronate monooxygenase [Anaerolineaceae bacterium]|nr:nitronate monooxygenase [Anaerolineaceae bacterium]